MRLRIGKLLVWLSPRGRGLDAGVSVHWDRELLVWVRFGRSGWRSFTERYQGTHGMPIEWRYFLNGWVSIKAGER